MLIIAIIIAFIIDKNDKRSRNRKKDKKVSLKVERNVIGKKWVCMDEYQRILTQTLSSSGLG